MSERSTPTRVGPNRPLLRRLLRYREWLLEEAGFTVRQATEELEVCERTIYRDMAYVRTLGWDVEFSRGRRRWILAGGGAPLSPAEGEAAALPLAGPDEAAEEVTLRFSPAAARSVGTRVWDEGETRERLPGGGLLLRLRAPVNARLLRFVLQHGAEVEVLGPEHLRRRVAHAHRLALAVYLRGEERESGR